MTGSLEWKKLMIATSKGDSAVDEGRNNV